MSDPAAPKEEQACPHSKKKYWKPGICQLRLADTGAEGDESVNACTLNDKICLLELNLTCETYTQWRAGSGDTPR